MLLLLVLLMMLEIKNKILEAMSMGLPVVSTKVGISGIKATDKVNFLLADNSNEFKNNVLKLVKDERLRENIGNNARVFVEENYSWDNSMKKMDEIIKRILT